MTDLAAIPTQTDRPIARACPHRAAARLVKASAKLGELSIFLAGVTKNMCYRR